jgi:catechol 2,3-dioxygenase-like lactoylglutathione lyase family enzyme
MQTRVAHMQFNAAAENLPFYRDLFAFLGWEVIDESDASLGVASQDGTSLWFIGEVKAVTNDYDGPGLNHLAIGAAAQADIDAAADFLRGKSVALLFGTPLHRPDFAGAEDQTYYQVMFESPDRILFEVVYTGPKDAD